MKQTTTATSVASLLTAPDGALKALLDRLAILEGMDLTLQSLLPATLRGQCRAGVLSGDCLEVVCRNAGAATRLRFMAPDLVNALRERGLPQIRKLQIRLSATGGG